MARVVAWLLIVGSLLAAPEALAAKRIAFVAGTDRYQQLDAQQQLRKAVNDARAISQAFRSLGYEVMTAENATRRELLRQWQLFLNRLEPGDETAFFFAGHGVEIGGQNFLLASDVPKVSPGEEEVLKAEGLALNSLLDQVRDRHPQVSLYIVDACRDNPFFDGRGRSIGGTRGLARVEPPSGTFIMFSAGSNETALDRLSEHDGNPNSIYTRVLLPKLTSPGRITEIARDVRRSVREIAQGVAHVQTPAYYDEVVGELCPAGCEPGTPAVKSEPAPPPVAQAPAAPPVEAAAPATPPPTVVAAVEEDAPVPRATPNAMEDPTPTLSIPMTSLVWWAAFSPDGRRIAAGFSDNTIGLWDTVKGKAIWTAKGHSAPVFSVAFSPDGKRIFSASEDKTIGVWDASNGKLLKTLTGHVSRLYAIAVSPDGSILASADSEGFIRLWDGKSYKPIRVLDAPNDAYAVYRLVFSPDGSQLAAGSGVHTFVWEPESAKLVWSLRMPDHGNTFGVAFSPDGKQLVVGGWSKTIRTFDLTDGRQLREAKSALEVEAIVYPSGSRLFVSGGDEAVNFWNARSELLKAVDTGLVTSLALSPDGTRLAVVGSGIKLYDLEAAKLVAR